MKNHWNEKNAIDHSQNGGRSPLYPNEYMVRLFLSKAFSTIANNYNLPLLDLLKKRQAHILDLGCGFANNLKFFLENNFKCTAMDINKEMVDLAKKSLKKMNFKKTTVKIGSCEKINAKPKSYDLILCMRAMHYLKGESGVKKFFQEVKRVLKPNGFCFIQTIGDKDDLRRNSTRIKKFEYHIKNYNFRTNMKLALFDNFKHFENTLKQNFAITEVGKLTEIYPKQKFDHYIGLIQV